MVYKDYDTITLNTDAALVVPMAANMTGSNVVILKVTGAKVRARLTSSDGSQQSIPVDSFFALTTRSVLITAIDLTRTPGVITTVDVFLGQLSQ